MLSSLINMLSVASEEIIKSEPAIMAFYYKQHTVKSICIMQRFTWAQFERLTQGSCVDASQLCRRTQDNDLGVVVVDTVILV